MAPADLDEVPEDLRNYTDLLDFPDFILNPLESSEEQIHDYEQLGEHRINEELLRLFDMDAHINEEAANPISTAFVWS